jgi:hypothetical protein
MMPRSIRLIIWSSLIIGLVVDAVTVVVVAIGRDGVPTSLVSHVAAGVMVATLALQATFVLVQLLPGGRLATPIGLDADGWMLVIMTTGIPGAFWHILGTIAGEPMGSIMPGFVTPLFNCVLLLAARLVQLRRAAPTSAA